MVSCLLARNKNARLASHYILQGLPTVKALTTKMTKLCDDLYYMNSNMCNNTGKICVAVS